MAALVAAIYRALKPEPRHSRRGTWVARTTREGVLARDLRELLSFSLLREKVGPKGSDEGAHRLTR